MAKKTAAGGIVSPANLWGKPLPNLNGSKPAPAPQAAEDESMSKRMLAEAHDDDDAIDSDVDAELEDDNDAAYAEAAEIDSADNADDDEVEHYEPEDGDDADEGDDDDREITAAAAGDNENEDDPKPADVRTGANKKVTTMSEKKSGADHIRDEIAKRQESGDSLRGVDIVAALAKRKITVSAAQVSQLLKKAGLGGSPRGGKKLVAASEDGKSRVASMTKKKAEPPRKAPKARTAPAPTGGLIKSLPMDQLKAAAAFLAACDNCYDSAADILAAHKQLHTMLTN